MVKVFPEPVTPSNVWCAGHLPAPLRDVESPLADRQKVKSGIQFERFTHESLPEGVGRQVCNFTRRT